MAMEGIVQIEESTVAVIADETVLSGKKTRRNRNMPPGDGGSPEPSGTVRAPAAGSARCTGCCPPAGNRKPPPAA